MDTLTTRGYIYSITLAAHPDTTQIRRDTNKPLKEDVPQELQEIVGVVRFIKEIPDSPPSQCYKALQARSIEFK